MNAPDIAMAIKKAKRVYIIGNGGSYANAMHICNDLLACGVKAYTLDPATLTAMSNDYDYSVAYARWLEVVGEPGDLLLALSGSGKSPNILNAVATALGKGMKVVPIYGAPKLKMQAAEEEQLKIGHQIRAWLLKNS